MVIRARKAALLQGRLGPASARSHPLAGPEYLDPCVRYRGPSSAPGLGHIEGSTVQTGETTRGHRTQLQTAAPDTPLPQGHRLRLQRPLHLFAPRSGVSTASHVLARNMHRTSPRTVEVHGRYWRKWEEGNRCLLSLWLRFCVASVPPGASWLHGPGHSQPASRGRSNVVST